MEKFIWKSELTFAIYFRAISVKKNSSLRQTKKSFSIQADKLICVTNLNQSLSCEIPIRGDSY